MKTKVFVSYSHDSKEHMKWVLKIATKLRSEGINIILDKWHLKLGQDLAAFMEVELSESGRILCICSENYVNKANQKSGGVGYEKQIITSEILADLNSALVIPVIRNNPSEKKCPTFLANAYYIDFEDDLLYEEKYEELLRTLHNEPVLPIPQIGPNPFKTEKFLIEEKFIPSNEKYISPSTIGKITFDYSNNNGCYSIGQGNLLFELKFSKASDCCIYFCNDPISINTVAIVKNKTEVIEISDARDYDGSSRVRCPQKNQIAVLRNNNGFYAAIKILDIKDDSRGADNDEVTFEYVIQTNRTPDFTK